MKQKNTQSTTSGGHPLVCEWKELEEVVGVVMALWRRVRTVCLTGCGSIWATFTTCSCLRFLLLSCENTTSCIYLPLACVSPCVPHAEACHDTHTSQINLRTHGFLEYLRCGISERLVGDYVNYVNLCAVVCLCTVMMGLKFLRRTGFGCECMWDVPEDRFIAQSLFFCWLGWFIHGDSVTHSGISFVSNVFPVNTYDKLLFLIKNIILIFN